MKKTLVVFMLIFLCLIVATPAFGSSTNGKELELTSYEFDILVNDVGLEEDVINFLSIQFLRELIEQDAVLLGDNGIITYSVETDQYDGEFGLMALDDKLSLYGAAYLVASDVPGTKKILLHSNFEWSENPVWKLTDGLSFGYPSHNEWYFPVVGGVIQQHSSTYCHTWNLAMPPHSSNLVCVNKTQPDYYDFNTGFGTNIDLASYIDSTYAVGWGFASQYLYVDENISKTTNLKIEYGHRLLSGSVSFSAGSSGVGVGITPHIQTDTVVYPLQFTY